MKVIGLLSRKGGVGKTTLAVHLAVLAQQAGQRTLQVDLDPQRSATAWWRAREAETPALVETEPAELRGILDAARADGLRSGRNNRHGRRGRAGIRAGGLESAVFRLARIGGAADVYVNLTRGIDGKGMHWVVAA